MKNTHGYLVQLFFGFLAYFFLSASRVHSSTLFEGTYFRGNGDTDFLEKLDISRRMFAPDPEFQNISMLYTPSWNGLVEGPTWDAWWIQNSYGPTYCALPFLQEPHLTFLQNSQDLWFDQMGDGVRKGVHDWVAPDGCLCDAARPGWIVYKQGDGRLEIHDWGMEFTAAGLLLQSELLLIERNREKIQEYLPKLRRCAEFLETRRDPENNLYLAGPAGNLLAPSYAGWKRPDGTYDKAYLTGLSVTTIAALDRLIELEKLAGESDRATRFTQRRDLSRTGLSAVTTDEGYLIKSLDPDGTRHGVLGAEKHGYFESSPNHDAIAFRVVPQDQAKQIYAKIQSIPGLRPHDFIIPNYPGLDDMYQEADDGLWKFGTWVNGGHWSTCEARMILAYYRLSQFEDIRRSMNQLLTFARSFRLDNPLVEFGSKVYQPKQPINLCYDSLGPAAAMIRGLFECIYSAEGLRLYPHIPPSVLELDLLFPIRLGQKQIYLATRGAGDVSKVRINGMDWSDFDGESVFIPAEGTPDEVWVEISLGGAVLDSTNPTEWASSVAGIAKDRTSEEGVISLEARVAPIRAFLSILLDRGLGNSYEASHARLAVSSLETYEERMALLKTGKISPLPQVSQDAADESYRETTRRICEGLENALSSYSESGRPRERWMFEIWRSIPDVPMRQRGKIEGGE